MAALKTASSNFIIEIETRFTLLLFQHSTNHGSGSSSSSRSKFNCEDEGFKYVAGYIAHAFRTKYPEFGSKTCKKFAKKDFVNSQSFTWLEMATLIQI